MKQKRKSLFVFTVVAKTMVSLVLSLSVCVWLCGMVVSVYGDVPCCVFVSGVWRLCGVPCARYARCVVCVWEEGGREGGRRRRGRVTVGKWMVCVSLLVVGW